MREEDTEWSIDEARLVYGVARNDLHFLDINDKGELVLVIDGHSRTFNEILNEIRIENGTHPAYTSSFTLRIPQLIVLRVKRLRKAFARALKELNYKGEFLAVYPIKVNQRYDCVTTVLEADDDYGLEAGTKTELLLIKRALNEKSEKDGKDQKHRRIVCNGTKDPEYLDIIEECIKEGFHITISIESLHEARLVVEQFKANEVEMVLRLKPYIEVEGHWSHSIGRDSKFGLSIQDLFDVIDLFREKGFLESVTTILAHVGSQIEDVSSFKRFGKYMTNIFYQLRDMGLDHLHIIDFGGGLPVDYTSSNIPLLMEQYARNLVEGIQEFIGDNTPEIIPSILIEAGRGITAQGSLVVVKALEVRSVYPTIEKISEEARAILSEWAGRIRKTKTMREVIEIWNKFHEEFASEDILLTKTLQDEAIVGELEKITREHIAKDLSTKEPLVLESVVPVRNLWQPEHIVIGNFSVFNSIGDSVLVDQHFPIIPVKGLHVRPETTIRLVDITCDSDGEFSNFYRQKHDKILWTQDHRPLTLSRGEIGTGIPVGVLRDVVGSHFVIPLTGAYQDVIEMDHNLLGDLPDVQISVNKEGEWKIMWMQGAETMHQILQEVGFDIESDYDPYMSGSKK